MQDLHCVVQCGSRLVGIAVELHARQMCDAVSLLCGTLLRSSKHNLRMEGIYVLVKWSIGHEHTVVTRLYIEP